MLLHITSKCYSFLIFLHDKGHMYMPRVDRIFGSEYIVIHKSTWENETAYYQYHEFGRTHWKSLDTQDKRCDVENRYNATKCITLFLENSIGCSMGMAESNRDVKR